MPDNNITISEDRYEYELTQRWLEGIITGWDQAAEKLREDSGKAYAANLDDKARALRDLAKWASEMSATARTRAEEHKKEYLSDE